MKTFTLILLSFFQIVTITYSQNNIQKVVASDREQGAWLGENVAISGDYAIVGSRWENGYEGAAYIFENNTDGEFIEMAKISASIPLAGSYFGCSVDIDGNYAVVGANGESYDQAGTNFLNEAGAAYIFHRDAGGNWSQIQKIVASDRSIAGNFGWAISISGDDILVGATYEKKDETGNNPIDDAGAAYIFSKEGDLWVEKQKIVASDRGADDQFGSQVSINGGKAIVGVPLEDEDESGMNTLTKSGSAYTYYRDLNGNWSQSQKIVAPERFTFTLFGSSVSISGEYLAIGAGGKDKLGNNKEDIEGAGAVYTYVLSGDNLWENSQEIYASDAYHLDEFGHSLKINGEHLIIGAYSEDDYENGLGELFNAGAAYYFKLSNSNTWEETQKITAPIRAEADYFGFDVGITYDGTAVIGAYGEDEDENGENTLDLAGAAYLWKSGPANIAEINFPVGVSVYPNPAQNFINIKMNDHYNLEIRITDILGKTVISNSSFDKTNKLSVDISDLYEGIYFVVIRSDQYYSTSKIIKQ